MSTSNLSSVRQSLPGEAAWVKALRNVPAWRPPARPTVIISPHPDDETLGAGGLIASQIRRGIPVDIIAVTDGEAAYAGQTGLAVIRRVEQENAVRELGVSARAITRLGFPDAGVTDLEGELGERLSRFIDAGSLIVAPWSNDCHPDHEACGRVAERLARATGATLISYLFWSWHHHPVNALVPLPLRRFELSESLMTAKSKALSRHKSQLERDDGPPILPEVYLGPARRNFETFII